MARVPDDKVGGNAKAPKGRKIPYPPAREASLPEIRSWLSNAAGLPPEVRIDAVTRAGPDADDPATILLSNGMNLRCSTQAQLQQARTLQAFLASTTEGIALPQYLGPAEVGDFYLQLCRLANVLSKHDAVAELQEWFGQFVRLGEELHGSLEPSGRYTTIEALRARPLFDKAAAQGVRYGAQPEGVLPVLLIDTLVDENGKAIGPDGTGRRYVRSLEWINYMRFTLGEKFNTSGLPARMSEFGAKHWEPQAWPAPDGEARRGKRRMAFYILPAEEEPEKEEGETHEGA